MLTFLRKIRKSLIESGSTRKYLLYAIGEVALVVIGILIALQINNWNEWRKERIIEIELLKTIESDLKSTLSDVTNDFENHLKSQKSAIQFKRFLLGEEMSEDSIIFHFDALMQDRHFFPKTIGYESLKSSDMTLVSDDSLRLIITELYEITFPRIKEWDESNTRWDIGMLLNPYWKKHFMLSNQIAYRQHNSLGAPLYSFKLMSEEEIRQDIDLQIDLQQSTQLRGRKISLTKSGIDRIKTTLQAIHEGLERMGAIN